MPKIPLLIVVARVIVTKNAHLFSLSFFFSVSNKSEDRPMKKEIRIRILLLVVFVHGASDIGYFQQNFRLSVLLARVLQSFVKLSR